jgi:ABC-type glycerol-3-phosphate transport system substrate-binding protein
MRPARTSLRSLAVVAASVLSVGALAACGDSSSSSSSSGAPKLTKQTQLKDPTSPVTLHYVGAAYPAKAYKPVFAAFEKAHPNIKIDYQEVPQDQLNNVLTNRISGSDIDIFDVDMPRVAAYNARGWLTDLTPAFGNLDGKIDKASLDASTVDGKLVGMPLQTSEQLLYYNKKLLKKAGIPDPSADPAQRQTWEQVVADAKKAQAAGAKDGLLLDQYDTYYQLQPLAMSAGGGAGAKGAGNLTPDITNAGWQKAMSWYGGLFADGVSPRGLKGSDTPAEFASGKLAYYVGGPWWAPQFEGEKNLDFGVAAHPYFQGGKPYTPTGAWSLGLNKNSKNVEAAEIFLRFIGLDNGGFSQYITDLAVPPANVQGTEKYYSGDVFTDPRMAGAADIIKYELANTATVRVKTAGYVEFEAIVTRMYDDIINGTPASKALSKASSDLDAAWAKYR